MIPEPTEALPAAMIEAAVAYQARTPFPGAGKGSEWIAGLYLAMEAAREPEAGKLREMPSLLLKWCGRSFLSAIVRGRGWLRTRRHWFATRSLGSPPYPVTRGDRNE
jgi:hypothetical protein